MFSRDFAKIRSVLDVANNFHDLNLKITKNQLEVDMPIQVRYGFFETNSSSVHAICIPKNLMKFSIPNEVNLYLINEDSSLYPIFKFETKVNFLISVLYAAKSANEIVYLLDKLETCKVQLIFKDKDLKDIYNGQKVQFKDLDFSRLDDLVIAVRKVLYNDNLLLKYLFDASHVDFDDDYMLNVNTNALNFDIVNY